MRILSLDENIKKLKLLVMKRSQYFIEILKTKNKNRIQYNTYKKKIYTLIYIKHI